MDSGWMLGFAIGGGVVVVVVAVVLTIIWLAARIRDQTARAVEHLVRAESATAPLWQVRTTAHASGDVLACLQRVRARQEGG